MIGNGARGIQVRAIRHDGWTKARRKTFLEVLATTCNVRGAAAASGMTATGAYTLRQRDAEFAGAWAAAIADGGDRLKEKLLAYLLGQTGSGDHPDTLDPAPVESAGPFDPDRAMQALKTLAAIDSRRGLRGARPTYASDAEVTVLLMERLNALAAKVAKTASRRARP